MAGQAIGGGAARQDESPGETEERDAFKRKKGTNAKPDVDSGPPLSALTSMAVGSYTVESDQQTSLSYLRIRCGIDDDNVSSLQGEKNNAISDGVSDATPNAPPAFLGVFEVWVYSLGLHILSPLTVESCRKGPKPGQNIETW
jgi:hypothetical protein